MSGFIACHNYYPKEYTGLSLERVRRINERLKWEGFRTMAFVPGDVDLSEDGGRRVKLLNRNLVGFSVTLDPAYKYLAETIHHDRRDSSEYLFRSVESRILKKRVEPANCTERRCGSICISNRRYGRYEGEVEIPRQDLPPDERVNVVGQVAKEDLKYLLYLKNGMGVQLNPVHVENAAE